MYFDSYEVRPCACNMLGLYNPVARYTDDVRGVFYGPTDDAPADVKKAWDKFIRPSNLRKLDYVDVVLQSPVTVKPVEVDNVRACVRHGVAVAIAKQLKTLNKKRRAVTFVHDGQTETAQLIWPTLNPGSITRSLWVNTDGSATNYSTPTSTKKEERTYTVIRYSAGVKHIDELLTAFIGFYKSDQYVTKYWSDKAVDFMDAQGTRSRSLAHAYGDLLKEEFSGDFIAFDRTVDSNTVMFCELLSEDWVQIEGVLDTIYEAPFPAVMEKAVKQSAVTEALLRPSEDDVQGDARDDEEETTENKTEEVEAQVYSVSDPALVEVALNDGALAVEFIDNEARLVRVRVPLQGNDEARQSTVDAFSGIIDGARCVDFACFAEVSNDHFVLRSQAGVAYAWSAPTVEVDG